MGTVGAALGACFMESQPLREHSPFTVRGSWLVRAVRAQCRGRNKS